MYEKHCKDTIKESLRRLSELSVDIAAAIKNNLKEKHINNLYIATPEYKHEMVTILKKTLPQVKTENYINLPAKYKGDNYVWSLVEQEIAQRANYFIGSSTSRWSFFVTFFRSSHNKSSIRLCNLPSFPMEAKELPIMSVR
ncbi:uncharacterized protein LOC144351952 [Saccoglossus kowalevskii]